MIRVVLCRDRESLLESPVVCKVGEGGDPLTAFQWFEFRLRLNHSAQRRRPPIKGTTQLLPSPKNFPVIRLHNEQS